MLIEIRQGWSGASNSLLLSASVEDHINPYSTYSDICYSYPLVLCLSSAEPLALLVVVVGMMSQPNHTHLQHSLLPVPIVLPEVQIPVQL
jgi:hypothetical protein